MEHVIRDGVIPAPALTPKSGEAATMLLIAFSIISRRSFHLPAPPNNLKRFEGRYVVPGGQDGFFTLKPSERGSLILKSEPENNCHIPVSKRGRHLPGPLHRKKSLEKIFLSLNEGGRILISAKRKYPGEIKRI